MALPIVGCSSSTSSTPPPPPPSGATNFVYTANAAGSPATVSALVSDPTTGALSAISGSPYNTGSGSRAVQATAAGNFLYVTNYFSGDISVFTINQATGALAELVTSPFAAELGVGAIAVDPTGKFLYAVSERSDNLFAFSIDSTGALSSLASSPLSIDPAETGSHAITVDPSGKFLFTTTEDSLTAGLYGFTRNLTTGALTPIGAPVAIEHGAHAVVTDPAGKFVIVVSSGSSTLFGSIAVFTLDSTSGALTPVSGSPFHTGVDPASVTVDPSGKFVFTANTADATVSAFTLATSGALTPVANSPFPSGGNGSVNGPTGIVADASGQYVYVCNASNDISVFKINARTGALTALTNSPFPAGGNGPSGITVVRKK
ncbi:MAG: beta-propeller fold lactonase family protein [Terriglobales bacterium]